MKKKNKINWKEVFHTWTVENQAIWPGGKAAFKLNLQNNIGKTLIPKFIRPFYIWFKVLIFPITKRKVFKDKTNLRWNVYNANGTMGKYFKQWHNYHFTVKMKLIYPLVKLLKFMMRKYYLQNVPDLPQYRNLKVMERANKRAMTEWYKNWMNPYNKEKNNEKRLQEKLDNYIFSDIFRLMMTMTTQDTATFEFVNIWAFCLAKEMHKEYADTGLVKHVLYTNSSSFDYAYYLIHQTLCKNKEGQYKDVKITMEQIRKEGLPK